MRAYEKKWSEISDGSFTRPVELPTSDNITENASETRFKSEFVAKEYNEEVIQFIDINYENSFFRLNKDISQVKTKIC